MGPVRHLFLLALLLLLGACSLRGMIDAATPAADRAFAQEMVSRLRKGDRPWLQRHFDPELWENSHETLGAVPPMFPAQAGATQLIGYTSSTNMANGRTERRKAFTLVSDGGGRWTVTTFQTYSAGDAERVVQWSVAPHDTIPPELAMLDAWETTMPWVLAVFAAIVAGGAGLFFWLVRRSRRSTIPGPARTPGVPNGRPALRTDRARRHPR
jgi:hypothetical protein